MGSAPHLGRRSAPSPRGMGSTLGHDMLPTTPAGAILAGIEQRFVTIDELAVRLCRNRFTLYHWLAKAPERLPRVTRIHGRVLFLERDVRAFFKVFEGAPAAQRIADGPEPKRGRGRPTKAETAARREHGARAQK